MDYVWSRDVFTNYVMKRDQVIFIQKQNQRIKLVATPGLTPWGDHQAMKTIFKLIAVQCSPIINPNVVWMAWKDSWQQITHDHKVVFCWPKNSMSWILNPVSQLTCSECANRYLRVLNTVRNETGSRSLKGVPLVWRMDAITKLKVPVSTNYRSSN